MDCEVVPRSRRNDIVTVIVSIIVTVIVTVIVTSSLRSSLQSHNVYRYGHRNGFVTYVLVLVLCSLTLARSCYRALIRKEGAVVCEGHSGGCAVVCHCELLQLLGWWWGGKPVSLLVQERGRAKARARARERESVYIGVANSVYACPHRYFDLCMCMCVYVCVSLSPCVCVLCGYHHSCLIRHGVDAQVRAIMWL